MQQIIDDVREGLEDKLRVRGRSLAVQVRRAGRRLPRAVRRDAVYLARSENLAKNPKLVRMIDRQKAQDARARILAYLETVDIGAERRLMGLQITASIAFAILFTAIVLLFVLVQRGFVS